MKLFPLILILITSMAKASDCSNPSDLEAIEAPELSGNVRPTPIYPKESNNKQVPGCALLTFELLEKPGTDARALIPANIAIEKTSEHRFGAAAVSALERWFYDPAFATTGVRYFVRFAFEPE